jgi:hypothetical protein
MNRRCKSFPSESEKARLEKNDDVSLEVLLCNPFKNLNPSFSLKLIKDKNTYFYSSNASRLRAMVLPGKIAIDFLLYFFLPLRVHPSVVFGVQAHTSFLSIVDILWYITAGIIHNLTWILYSHKPRSGNGW